MMLRKIFLFFCVTAILFSHTAPVYALDMTKKKKEEFKTELFDLSEDTNFALLPEYADIVANLQKETANKWDAELFRGAISDLDEDGFPELVLLFTSYSKDSAGNFEVQIYNRSEAGKLQCTKCILGANAGGPRSAVYLSYGDDGSPMIHLVYSNTTRAIYRWGVDNLTEFSSGELKTIHDLRWIENMETMESAYEVDGKIDIDAFAALYGSISCVLCEYGGGGLSLDDLKYEILHYKA